MGFGIVFFSWLLLSGQYFYNGLSVAKYRLWQFYLMEARRALTSSGMLGPTSGSGGRALVIFLQHLAVAGVGGLVSLGIGVLSTRDRGSRDS